ncbi:putative NAD(P)/FAD-binding protein YdhS [Sphingomonas zeicaulis]|uniref:FAD/NAD(P)-binding protein n=1 Tax=Sphingomonas zeicaulis TaxID=1632740 RepID=UPI003D1E9637
MIRNVTIVGAGFAGTLQAINLLRHDGPRATLIERSSVPGTGLAYGAAHPGHVLNVRAANMSAFPDDPGHFVRWLEANGRPDAGSAFVERVTYGVYLRGLLDEACRRAGDRLTVVRGEVVDVANDDGAVVTLADGTRLHSDAAVLAVGNLPPHDPPGLDAATLSDRYRRDPWSGVSDGLGTDDVVLLIGTGLTMIDVALMLEARGFAGRIVALSRRGLLPRRHEGHLAPQDRINERPVTTASALLASVRERAAAIGWRHAVDELRPFTQAMWGSASVAERSRFLRHLRPWWDVHRHRLAPSVAERLAAMQARGFLTVVAGKTIAFAEQAEGIALDWRPRGSDRPERLVAQRAINCTGPLGDLHRTTEPLLQRLVARGTIRADIARLGIDVDGVARTIAADDASNDWLYALGPMTRGAFWEIVAVPDIRTQTWSLARRLANAQWVGGEGL